MMINHRKNWFAGMLVAGVAALPALPVAGAGAKDSASSALKSFHGTVRSVSRADDTFTLRRANGATLTFRVTATTRYERVGGRLGALTRGEAVEVKARRVGGV